VISVASATFSDAAGNTNNDGADTNNSVSLTVDTIRPTIAIASNVSTLKAGETASLTFTLSEASTNFTAADISAQGGSISNFAGSGTAYTATFTPTADSTASPTALSPLPPAPSPMPLATPIKTALIPIIPSP
jgi:hypothetical protein